MIAFADFQPRELSPSGFFKNATFSSLEATLAEANKWIDENQVEVINVETVVLPNMNDKDEEGTIDPELRASGEMSTYWYQFIRVWYRK